MKSVWLQPVGEAGAADLRRLMSGLEAAGFRCAISPDPVDPAFAFHPARGQYHSTEILARLVAGGRDGDGAAARLAVTPVDLFIPILTFVFGEAQVDGPWAIVSTRRLRQEFYGLPADPRLEDERLLKEALHEIGHTCGLHHCHDYRCAMASSHAVESIDLKEAAYCESCAGGIG